MWTRTPLRVRAITACHFSLPLSSSRRCHAKIAVVGGGPAGFYTALRLLKSPKNVHVDIYEKMPVPFGLVRYGVAPDHPEVKNVTNTFTEMMHKYKDRCSFYGNVEIGQDVSVSELQSNYTGTVFSYGADEDKTMGIPGEDLDGVLSAREIVGWYNGHPSFVKLQPDFSGKTAVIIGQGNVALDIARLLLMPPELLKGTDICQSALETISGSRIRKVITVGRRGPLQVAFTIKELREMVNMEGCKTIIDPNDFSSIKNTVSDLPRPRKRLTELLMKAAGVAADGQPIPVEGTSRSDVSQLSAEVESGRREWELKFCRSPVEIKGDPSHQHVTSIRLAKNILNGDDYSTQTVESTRKSETIPCGLVIRSIGYRSLPLDGLMFDEKEGTLAHVDGRMMLKGLYCSGWVKRGPVGVIATTMSDAYSTADVLLSDLESGAIGDDLEHKGSELIGELLRSRGVYAISFNEWEKIDAVEKKLGEYYGRPRQKITSFTEMLRVGSS